MFISRICLQVVHQKTAACLCLTTVKNEDKLEFSKILEAIKVNKKLAQLELKIRSIILQEELSISSNVFFCLGLNRQTSTTSTRSTGRSGEEASWDPSLKPRPKLRRGFLPRRLPREWTKRSISFELCFCLAISWDTLKLYALTIDVAHLRILCSFC